MKEETTGKKEKRADKFRIEGIAILKALVASQGEGVLQNRRIALQLLEDLTLTFYKLQDTPTNRLYVYIQLVQYFRARGMWLGNLIEIPDTVYQRILIS